MGISWGDITAALSTVGGWAQSALRFLLNNLNSFKDYLFRELKRIGAQLKATVHPLWRAINDLAHFRLHYAWLDLRTFWAGLMTWWQKFYDRFIKPFDDLRKRLDEIYDKFFKPIIHTIDDLRRMVQVIAIFDKSLAAKLDAKLRKLEGDILAPLIGAIQRLNVITSYFHAIVSRRGYLDRPLMLETLRRDAALVWQIIVNPLPGHTQVITPAPTRTMGDVKSDFLAYIGTGSGAYAAELDRCHQLFRDEIVELK